MNNAVDGSITGTAPPRGARLARNALSGVPRYGIGALLALAVTPYSLRVLGVERFGLWALAGALLAVLRLVDLGITRALVRAISRAAAVDAQAGAGGHGAIDRAAAAGRADSAAAELATARLLLALIGASSVAVVWLTADLLARYVFAVPPALLGEARVVLVGTSAVVAIESLFSPWSATLEGLGRLDRVNMIDTLQRVASALGVVLVLGWGWGLAGLVWKNAVTALGAGLAYAWAARRAAPALAGTPMRIHRPAARELLSFGRHVQAANLAVVMVEPVSKAILSHSRGLAALAGFELVMRITTLVGSVLTAMGQAIFPAVAGALAGAGDAAGREVRRLYATSARYLSWIALPSCGLLGLLAGPFVAAWLGPSYADVAWGMRVLAVGWLVAILGMPAFLVLQAGGAVARSTASALVTAASAIGLAFFFAGPFGLRGVLVATAAGMAAGSLVNWWAVSRLLGWTLTFDFVDGRAIVAAGVGAVVASAVAMRLPAGHGLAGVAGVAVAGLAGVVAYGAALTASGALGTREWRLLRGALGGGSGGDGTDRGGAGTGSGGGKGGLEV